MKNSSKFLSVLMTIMMAFSVIMVPVHATDDEPEEGNDRSWRNLVEDLEQVPEEAQDFVPGFEPAPAPEPEPEPVVIEEPEYSSGVLKYETDEYEISVSYTEEALIPNGTDLAVREILSDSAEYADYFAKTLDKLNETAFETRKGIAEAMYFDVALMKDGQKLEPAVPVEVNISFKDGGIAQFTGEEAKVIHFAEDSTVIIEDPELTVEVSGEATPEGVPDGEIINEFAYEQDSFSVIGVFTTDVYAALIEAETGFEAPKLFAAGEVAADKTVTDNDGDGIYDLELYVMGSSEHSDSEKTDKFNIVLVIDRSGSMDEITQYDPYTYSQATYDSNTRYYYRNGNSYTRCYYVNYRWRTGTNRNSPQVPAGSTIYRGVSRMEATKKAASDLVDELLSNNKDEDGKRDIVEISLISFSGPNSVNTAGSNNNATILVDYNSANTTNATNLKNSINGITVGGATNWEAALDRAKTVADNFKRTEADESVAVIFLTDGKPTVYNGGGQGQEGDTNVQTCWNNAKDEARDIASTDSYTLYNIFAFGGGSEYLKSLTNYAYGRNGNWTDTADTDYTRSYFFDAQDTSALEAAFKAITHTISSSIGVGGVAITDGVNLGATNTSATIGGTVHQKEFQYTVYDGTRVLYSVKFDDSGNNATFTINNTTYTAACTNVTTEITNDQGEVVKTITSKVATVTVDGVEYKMSPATLSNAGLIEWELAGLGVLKNYKYALSMPVWPNQMSYDIAADMNNGIYPDLDTAIAAYGITDEAEIAKIKASIEKEADGSYAVYTNYEQSIRYYEADEETVDGVTTTTYSDEKTKPLTKPDPIPLTGSTIPMEKRWGSDLAIEELQELVFGKNNTYTGYIVTLRLKRDGEVYMTYTFPKLNAAGKPVDANGNESTDVRELVWHQDAAISPGRLTTKDPGGKDYNVIHLTGTTLDGRDISGDYFVVSDGHEYEIEEVEGADLHFEFSTDIYNPMLVDGKLMNVKVVRDSSGKIVDGSAAEILDPEMTSVYATNTLKGGINIRKVVTKEDKETEVADCTDEFTFEITLTKDGQPYSTPSDQYSATKPADYDTAPDHGGWSYDENHDFYYKSGFSAYNIYDGDGKRIDRSWIPADGKLTLTMPANGEIRVVNLPTGTTFTVKEVIGEGGEYQYLKTVSAIKYGEDDGEDLIEDDPEPVTTTNNEVSGTVIGNKANLITYYNWAASFYVYHAGDNSIEKISFSDERVVGTYDEETGKYTYTFNIVNEVKKDYIYGGYYKAYGGQIKKDADIIDPEKTEYVDKKTAKTSYEYVNDREGGFWATDAEGCVKYDGSKATAWRSANAYKTDKGTEMHPVSSTVYYLKEVPDGYLRPYIHIVYDTRHTNAAGELDNPLTQFYLITATDDNNYVDAGVLYDGETKKAPGVLSAMLKISPYEGDVVKLTAKTIFDGKTYADKSVKVPRGYLSAVNMTGELSNFADNAEFTMLPYFTTFDGVGVTAYGVTERTVNVGEKRYVKGDDGNGVAPGITVTDNQLEKPRYE